MARNTIKYQLKQELEKQASYGRSKHQDKISTYQKREEMKQQGASFEERMMVNDLKEHIYSYGTMATYQQQVSYFGDYLIKEGHKKISVEESRDYIQEYIDHLADEGKSSWTINTALAAICKATGAYMKDFDHPERTISKIERGSGIRAHDASNQRNAAHILDANRLLGMRRSELQRLKAGDIVERGDKVIVKSIGKGGRENQQVFTLPEEKAQVLALKEGKADHEKVFAAKDFRNDADLHHERQNRAVTVYNRVVEDMREHPERREYYKQEVREAFHERGKVCHENMDNPYCVRGENRKRLIAEDREVTYDRVALLYVSTTVLNHTRSDVTAAHYVAK